MDWRLSGEVVAGWAGNRLPASFLLSLFLSSFLPLIFLYFLLFFRLPYPNFFIFFRLEDFIADNE
ncbi:hypothetical protein GQ53DRAFT_261594 [Thozetella sp. PMI_491]|nr:hypothetical protein GQ53DRAFT_261594 [Thozetella sp. PMI_491]